REWFDSVPSAALGEGGAGGTRKALYEPVHGSAPDIAGNGIANPIAMIGSFAMALRYSFNLGELADRVEAAISGVLAKGLRTADIAGNMKDTVSTSQMGNAILAALQAGLDYQLSFTEYFALSKKGVVRTRAARHLVEDPFSIVIGYLMAQMNIDWPAYASSLEYTMAENPAFMSIFSTSLVVQRFSMGRSFNSLI